MLLSRDRHLSIDTGKGARCHAKTARLHSSELDSRRLRLETGKRNRLRDSRGKSASASPVWLVLVRENDAASSPSYFCCRAHATAGALSDRIKIATKALDPDINISPQGI